MEDKYLSYKNEIAELKQQLEEANDTINAIRNGQVDALIINDEQQGHLLFTLRSADQTYRLFIEKMSEGAVTLNTDGIILYSNSSFANKMDASLEKIIGMPFIDFVTETDKNNYTELFSKSWKKEIKTELTLTTKTGKILPFTLSFASLELEEGTSLSIILTDLSGQKDIEKKLKTNNGALEAAQQRLVQLNNDLERTIASRTDELRLSQEYFKMLANSMPQMCWTNSPRGEIDFYNQRWYDYTGLTFQESKNRGLKMVIHPDDLADTVHNYKRSLQTGKVFVLENRYKRADGRYRWHLNRGIPVKNESGEIVMWVGTATDINDQRKAMEKKDEFIGIASHELKTPLTSLKGYLQLITNYQKQELPPIIKQFIARANQSINKLQNLVNDLLDVSKIHAGKLEFKKEPISSLQFITSCEDSARLIYPEFEFKLEIKEDYKVFGNAERLEQVIMNFISNAVKYSNGDKKVVISVEKEGQEISFCVKDHGIGLSNTQKERVFERFYRVEDKNHHTSGLGMGLFISAEIIKTHDGKIGLTSKLGKGSVFYFTLPEFNVPMQ